MVPTLALGQSFDEFFLGFLVSIDLKERIDTKAR